MHTVHTQRGHIKYTYMYTFLFTLAQLERCHDLQDLGQLRIIHMMLDERSSYEQARHYEDLYVTLIECSPQQATLLCLI